MQYVTLQKIPRTKRFDDNEFKRETPDKNVRNAIIATVILQSSDHDQNNCRVDCNVFTAGLLPLASTSRINQNSWKMI